MQIESIANIRDLWSAEEVRARDKVPPADFPALPEVPAGRYSREDFFQAEKQHLWPHTWLFVSVADEVPQPGSYRSYTINGAPVLVVRDHDQQVRAFYNVCQHRGASLTTKAEGQVNRLTCRYHCWSYRLDGALEFVPDEHDFPGLDRSRKGLKPLRCERLGNLIFISFDAQIQPLREYLGGLGDVLSDVPFDKVRLYRTLTYEAACNWKCIHDAFSETYHVRSVHAQSVNQAIESKCTARFMFPNGHNGMVVKARGNESSGMVNVFDRASPSGQARPKEGMKEVTRMAQRSYNVFPNMTMPIAENLFPILSLWPLEVGKTRMEVRFLKLSDGPEDFDTPTDQEVVAFFDKVTKEDLSALEDMQAGLSSAGIDAMPLCYGEQFIYNFHQELDRVIGRANIAPELQVGEVDLPLVHRVS